MGGGGVEDLEQFRPSPLPHAADFALGNRILSSAASCS